MLLRSEKLTKSFGGLVAVNAIDFSIGSGEVVGVIGPNGSGKTTLFNVLSGILPVTSGKIFFNDQDVTLHKAHEMTALGMARTFQNIRLFQNLTARDNIIVGRFSRTGSGLFDGVIRSQRLRGRNGIMKPKPGNCSILSVCPSFRISWQRTFLMGRNAGWKLPGPWPASRFF